MQNVYFCSSALIFAQPYGLWPFKIRFRASPTWLWKKICTFAKLVFCKDFAMVKEWSRNSQGHLEFKILIFFLQNEIEDALGRILNTINRYLHAKMCEKQCKTRIFALARSFLLESIRWWYSKFVSERALPDYEKKLANLQIEISHTFPCKILAKNQFRKCANFFS